jgi:hypothetical protein
MRAIEDFITDTETHGLYIASTGPDTLILCLDVCVSIRVRYLVISLASVR